MVSRALSLAALTLLIGGLRPEPALSQAQNLEAGKSPSQIFAGTCTACHKGPRGLLKTVPAGSLPGFLRQHYTTSPEMASLLAGFLVSNGAADTRYAQPKAGRDDKSDARFGGAPDQLDRFGRRMRAAPQQQAEPREPGTPETAAVPDSPRLGRNERRFARPSDAPGAEGNDPFQAAIERGPDGRRLSAKQKQSRRGKPGGEEPKTDVANPDSGKQEAAKNDAAQGDVPKNEAARNEGKSEATKSETPGSETPQNEVAKNEAVNSSSGKPEPSRLPAGDAKSEPAKLEASKETGNADVAAVRPEAVAPTAPAAAVSAAVPSGTPDQPPVLSTPPSPRAVTAAAPAPVAPAGPPAPPISR